MILSQDLVRLVGELPELQLHDGDMGTVRKSWHYPTVAYEVEFFHGFTPISVLLFEHQLVANNTDSLGTLHRARNGRAATFGISRN
jgi:hypothetical protein